MTFPMRLKISVRRDLVTVRTHGQILNDTFRESGEKHKKETMRKHFEINEETRPGGAYKYQKRSQEYRERKANQVGHQRPLVLTGRMRLSVLFTAVVRATQHGWSYTAKNYFAMLKKRREELEAVSPEEVRDYVADINREYIRRAYMPENRRKTKWNNK